MAEDQLERIRERVGNGIEWLVAHDPAGRFHLWFQARILPTAAAPGQTQESMDEYRAYYRARQQWEQLWREMERQERAAGESATAATAS